MEALRLLSTEGPIELVPHRGAFDGLAPLPYCVGAKKQFSSGVIEGMNNKAKVTLRKAYGNRTFRIAELSLYHVLGRLPEPKLAHRFF